MNNIVKINKTKAIIKATCPDAKLAGWNWSVVASQAIAEGLVAEVAGEMVCVDAKGIQVKVGDVMCGLDDKQGNIIEKFKILEIKGKNEVIVEKIKIPGYELGLGSFRNPKLYYLEVSVEEARAEIKADIANSPTNAWWLSTADIEAIRANGVVSSVFWDARKLWKSGQKFQNTPASLWAVRKNTDGAWAFV